MSGPYRTPGTTAPDADYFRAKADEHRKIHEQLATSHKYSGTRDPQGTRSAVVDAAFGAHAQAVRSNVHAAIVHAGPASTDERKAVADRAAADSKAAHEASVKLTNHPASSFSEQESKWFRSISVDKGKQDKNPWTIYSHAFDVKEMGKSQAHENQATFIAARILHSNLAKTARQNGNHSVAKDHENRAKVYANRIDSNVKVPREVHLAAADRYGKIAKKNPEAPYASMYEKIHRDLAAGDVSKSSAASQEAQWFRSMEALKGLKSTAIHELHHPRTASQTREAIDHLRSHNDEHTPKEQVALEERVRRAAKKHGVSMAANKSPEAAKRSLERKAKMAHKAIKDIEESPWGLGEPEIDTRKDPHFKPDLNAPPPKRQVIRIGKIEDLERKAKMANKSLEKAYKAISDLQRGMPEGQCSEKGDPIPVRGGPHPFQGKGGTKIYTDVTKKPQEQQPTMNLDATKGELGKSKDDEGYDTVTHKQIHVDLEKHPNRSAAIRRAAHYHAGMALRHMQEAEKASDTDKTTHYAAARAHRDAQYAFMDAHNAHIGNSTFEKPDEALSRAKTKSHEANGHSAWSLSEGDRAQRVPELGGSVSKAMTAASMPRIPRALMNDTYRSATAVMTRNHSSIAKDIHTGPLTDQVILEVQEEERRRARMPMYKSCNCCGRTYMAKGLDDPCPTCSVNKSQYCPTCKSHLVKGNGGISCPLCG